MHMIIGVMLLLLLLLLLLLPGKITSGKIDGRVAVSLDDGVSSIRCVKKIPSY